MTDRDAVVRELVDRYQHRPYFQDEANAELYDALCEAFDAGHAAGERAGREAERAEVVEWVRDSLNWDRRRQRDVALDIERGAHRGKPEEP